MDSKKGKGYLLLDDIKKHGLWKENRVDDLLYPVTCESDAPDDIFDLFIRAKFTTPFGLEFLGYIVGCGDIYCIAIFVGDKIFYFNRNLQGDYLDSLNKMSVVLGKNITLSNFSPLKYKTDFSLNGFNNFEGEFDLLKKRTNEERLKRFEGKM